MSSGWVSLSGLVTSGYQRSLAESLVRPLIGVREIINEITVKPADKMPDVKQKIEAAFQRQAHLDAADIDIQVDQRKVTLKGYVHSWREKEDAERAALAAPGVAAVENQLRVQL
jgi:osmotically-inducible protein OsmY